MINITAELNSLRLHGMSSAWAELVAQGALKGSCVRTESAPVTNDAICSSCNFLIGAGAMRDHVAQFYTKMLLLQIVTKVNRVLARCR
jgi:hypothetical protein